MGMLMYTILTELYLYEKPKLLKRKEASKEIAAGRRSPYPSDIQNSTDPAHIAVKKAIDMCWTEQWRERPAARTIADYLMGQLREITGEVNPDVRITMPYRDPGQKRSESDYNKHAWI